MKPELIAGYGPGLSEAEDAMREGERHYTPEQHATVAEVVGAAVLEATARQDNDPNQRLKVAAREFCEALNGIDDHLFVEVEALEITQLQDAKPKYRYSVTIEKTTTEQVYP